MLVGLAGCRPHEEDEWNGRLLRVGEAVVRVGGPVPRCATTTRDPETGERDFDTLTHDQELSRPSGRQEHRLRRLRRRRAAGRVRVGDPVELIEEE